MKTINEFLQKTPTKNYGKFNIEGYEILVIDALNDEAIFLKGLDDIKELCGEDAYKKVKKEIKGFSSCIEYVTDDSEYAFISLV